ncbi:glutaredoxin [Haloferula luteola]|uniref:Glutaredoxin n=1 Tax=Haloferula luteola TaxID=595692 RepID=A0A840V1Z3_9BACT|nr:glutaredoxin family protein [Haloferula luteola]MBB5352012.1 glutaredoxin [Haloferula luteola]
MRPLLYIKSGCPWCIDAEAYLRREGIEYDVVDVLRDREAMAAMKEISGQTKAPTLDWDGEVLADFGVDELIPFLEKIRRAS